MMEMMFANIIEIMMENMTENMREIMRVNIREIMTENMMDALGRPKTKHHLFSHRQPETLKTPINRYNF